jgi:type II secretory pathway component GspD/PulD (secretin)/tetratricopeptide (TPR) repeat protein
MLADLKTCVSRRLNLSFTSARTAMALAVFAAVLAAPAARAQEPKPAEPDPAPSQDAPKQAEPAPEASKATAPSTDAPKLDPEQVRTAAQDAMKKGQWQAAMTAWAQVLSALPGDEEAVRERARAQSMLEGGSVIDTVVGDREIRRQQAVAEFNSAIKRAEDYLARQDYDNASLAAQTARVRLDVARGVLPPADMERMSAQAEQLITKIKDDAREHKLETEQKSKASLGASSEASRRSEAENRANKVASILVEVRKLQARQQYEAALQALGAAIEIDPLNPSVLALRDALQTTIRYVHFSETQKRRSYGFSRLTDEAVEATVPPHVNVNGPGPRSTNALLTYPEDWETLTYRRDGRDPNAPGFHDSEENLAAWRVLNEQMQVPELSNVEFESAIKVALDGSMDGVGSGATPRLTYWIDWAGLKDVGLERTDSSGKEQKLLVSIEMQSKIRREALLRSILNKVHPESGDTLPPDTLAFDVQDGSVVVTSLKRLKQKKIMVVYDVRDLLFRAPDFTNAPEFNLNQSISQGGGGQGGGQGGGGAGGGGGGFGGGGGGGGFGGGGGGGGAGGGGGGIFGSPGEAPERGNPDELIKEIIDLIKSQVEAGWEDGGGDLNAGARITPFNRNLIINASADSHRAIENLLQQLRAVRALQINIEGRLISVSLDWFEQIGIDFDLYFNSNDRMWSAARAVNPDFQLKDFFFQRGGLGANPTNTGRLKNPVIWDTYSGNSTFANAFAGQTGYPVNDGSTPAGTGTSFAYGASTPADPVAVQKGEVTPINVQQEGLPLINSLAAAGLSTFGAAALASPVLTTSMTYLDDVQVDLLITATQADQRNVVLTAPRLTLFNCQRSWISVAKVIAYVSNLVPVTGDNSGAFSPIISNIFEGFVLDIEACISGDRRYVTMTVLFGLNQNVKFTSQTVTGAAGGGGGTGGGGRAANFEGTIQLPELSGTQINTTVTVPDKGTILLGGQRLVNELEIEVGVPLLSKIPVVNRFFTNRINAKTETSLLLLIRPEIIIQQEEENDLFPNLRSGLNTGAGF